MEIDMVSQELVDCFSDRVSLTVCYNMMKSFLTL